MSIFTRNSPAHPGYEPRIITVSQGNGRSLRPLQPYKEPLSPSNLEERLDRPLSSTHKGNILAYTVSQSIPGYLSVQVVHEMSGAGCTGSTISTNYEVDGLTVNDVAKYIAQHIPEGPNFYRLRKP